MTSKELLIRQAVWAGWIPALIAFCCIHPFIDHADVKTKEWIMFGLATLFGILVEGWTIMFLILVWIS